MKVFVGSLLLVFFMAARPAPVPDCDGLQYKLTITHTSNGENNGRIEVEIIKSSSRVRAYLYIKKGNQRKNSKEDVSVDELTGLAAGHYVLILQDAKCSAVEHDLVIK